MQSLKDKFTAMNSGVWLSSQSLKYVTSVSITAVTTEVRTISGES